MPRKTSQLMVITRSFIPLSYAGTNTKVDVGLCLVGNRGENDQAIFHAENMAPLAMRAGLSIFSTSRVIRFGRLRGPRARPYSLAAARGIGSHRRSVDPKEHWFREATFRRPPTSRTAVVLHLKQGQWALPRRFSLFPAELFQGISLVVDDDERATCQASAAREASRLAISRFNCRAMTSVTELMLRYGPLSSSLSPYRALRPKYHPPFLCSTVYSASI